ncbi:sigma-54-dependent Fis family transcriptional regulator [Edaphobacter sp. HDX4]|uniref:sigma-54-dependent transcriptional regulator n=1 Tax=Edaphobacter sp. HDX4 TaxID=2794064 RepID=UPI002FE53DBB
MHTIDAEDLELDINTLSKVFFDVQAKGIAPAEREQIKRPLTEGERLHVLVVDDDPQVRRACHQILKTKGAQVSDAGTLKEAELLLQKQSVDLLLLDLKLPDGGGLTLLEKTKVLFPNTAVVVMTAFATVSSAVEAMRIGARDYLTKPFALQELTTVLERAGQRAHFDQQSRLLREKLGSRNEPNALIGNSVEMGKLHRIISRVTFSTHPVLIVGESGTGKEAVARAIHFNGPNAAKPFVCVECRPATQNIIDEDLFGRTETTIAGRSVGKPGLLASSEGGTLFIDEISELSMQSQAKLVRALQEKEINLAGATAPFTVRVLAATSCDLSAMVELGRFRRDLFFRLNVVNLRIPPLRERREDIALLATHFLAKAEQQTKVQRTLSDDTLNAMFGYEWPGNIRELAGAIERACALSEEPVLDLGYMPSPLQEFRLSRTAKEQIESEPNEIQSRENEKKSTNEDEIITISELEKQAILGTIHRLNGDKLLAAKLLGIGKTTLYRKLREYGIEGLIENSAV